MQISCFSDIGVCAMTIKEYNSSSRADMYLPLWLLFFGCSLCILGCYCLLCGVLKYEPNAVITALICLLIGLSAILCWKNQKIYMISQSEFEYVTWLGNRYRYTFEDVSSIAWGWRGDHWTLFVANRKVHIESTAIISKRLFNRINEVINDRHQ